MKAISEFQITGMTVSGFKCFEVPTELAFGSPTVITGGNGRGKSSIADAIAFAITGLPFFGKRGIDRLHNEQVPELYVALRFIDESCRSHELGTRSAEQYQEKYTKHIAELTAQLGELGRKYRQEEVYLSGLVPGAVCPTCRREVTEADADTVHQSVKNVISQVLAEGKEIRQKLNELQALENKTRDTFLQFQHDDIERIENEIDSLQKQKKENAAQAKKFSEAHSRELESLQAQIQHLVSDLEYGNLSQEEYDRLREYKDAIRDCESRLETLEQKDAEPTDYDARLSYIQGKIAEKKKLLTNAALYMGKRAELIFSQLRMNRVAISLFDVVKTTGEVKDVFKFTYNGRRYDRLSLSEKIRAGMELSELMKRLTGRNYPVFADNMESVDDLSNVRPTGQVIMAKCVHNAELCVRPVNRISQTEKMAA